MAEQYRSKEERESAEYEKWGKLPPTVEGHGTDEDIRNNLKKLVPSSWRLEGNKLIGQTEFGELVQTIPTDYICHGIDKEGLPILKKIVL